MINFIKIVAISAAALSLLFVLFMFYIVFRYFSWAPLSWIFLAGFVPVLLWVKNQILPSREYLEENETKRIELERRNRLLKPIPKAFSAPPDSDKSLSA
jgi:hypothetical protein